MVHSKSGITSGFHSKHGLDRPAVSGLLKHILFALFSNGMVSLLLFGAAAIFLLQYNSMLTDKYYALLIAWVTALAVVRGCKAWQEDLNSYQRALSDSRKGSETRLVK